MEMLNDIIKAAIGKDSNNRPNSAITVSNDAYSLDDNNVRHINSHSSFKAVVDIKKLKDYMMIDLIFPSDIDPDLKLTWHALETYGQTVQNIEEDTNEVPFLSLTIVPMVFKSSYYLSAVTPFFWCLQPQKPGGSVNTIKLLFESEDFGFYETDEINLDDIEAETDRKIAVKENEMAAMERKEEEKAQYEYERNQKLEEFRRNNEI